MSFKFFGKQHCSVFALPLLLSFFFVFVIVLTCNVIVFVLTCIARFNYHSISLGSVIFFQNLAADVIFFRSLAADVIFS